MILLWISLFVHYPFLHCTVGPPAAVSLGPLLFPDMWLFTHVPRVRLLCISSWPSLEVCWLSLWLPVMIMSLWWPLSSLAVYPVVRLMFCPCLASLTCPCLQTFALDCFQCSSDTFTAHHSFYLQFSYHPFLHCLLAAFQTRHNIWNAYIAWPTYIIWPAYISWPEDLLYWARPNFFLSWSIVCLEKYPNVRKVLLLFSLLFRSIRVDTPPPTSSQIPLLHMNIPLCLVAPMLL